MAVVEEPWSQVQADQLAWLGQALCARADTVVERMERRTEASARVLDAVIEQRIGRVGRVSTVAVGRWMGGEGADVARSVGMEAWGIFGQLAAQRAAPLNEVTKRCLRWRDATVEVLHEEAQRLDCSQAALEVARGMVQRSHDVTLVRMCQSFEAERQRMHDELTRHQAELTFLATHDTLTGLPNRTLILDRVEQLLARGRRGQGSVTAIFIDLDNFKAVNDKLGHRAGDLLLRAVASRLAGVLRETDTLGRLGGDEFVIVAEAMPVTTGPELIAARLLDVLDQPFVLPGLERTPLTVTASLGIASGDGLSAEELLRDADTAMYRAKWGGKNRWVLFDSEMRAAAQSRRELEHDLQQALSRGQLFLVYQPTCDLRDMRPTGIEALLRWRHPQRGVVAPADFIPLLEQNGLIGAVGRWVLEEACGQAVAWRAEGHDLGVAVNVSARQLDSDAFVADVTDALAVSGLEPDALTIEIAEETLMRDADGTVERLRAVKELGVRIAVDDFGTGYSSLSHLQRFPVDALKIDRSFVARMASDHEGQTLIRTLVQLGKALRIETLAEGIEQRAQLDQLRGQDCDGGQGFLFAHPLDADGVVAFLRTWRDVP